MADRKKVGKVKLTGGTHTAVRGQKSGVYKATTSTAKKKTAKLKKTTDKKPVLKKVKSENVVMMPAKSKVEENKRATAKTNPINSRVAQGGKRTTVKQPSKQMFSLNLGIILGKREEQRKKRLITYLVVLPFIMAILIFCLTTPTGPIEAITNGIATVGGGSFPKAVTGSKVLSLKTVENRAFLLTDTHIIGYTDSGKEMFQHQHNFSSPVLEASSTRTLVYNRESTDYVVHNNSQLIYEKKSSKPIFCADISNNGSIALVTEADKYAAQVEVFSSGMKSKFIWYLVDGLVSDIAISNNGKKIAIAVLKVKDGAFDSEIVCFDIGSETPLFTIPQKGTHILKLETVSSSQFSYVTGEGISYVKWKDGTQTSLSEGDLSPVFYKIYDNKSVAVFGKNTSCTVNIYDKKGEKLGGFTYNSLIDDVTFSNKRVYLLKSTNIYELDFEGNLLNTRVSEQSLNIISATDKGVLAADNLSLMFFEHSKKE